MYSLRARETRRDNGNNNASRVSLTAVAAIAAATGTTSRGHEKRNVYRYKILRVLYAVIASPRTFSARRQTHEQDTTVSDDQASEPIRLHNESDATFRNCDVSPWRIYAQYANATTNGQVRTERKTRPSTEPRVVYTFKKSRDTVCVSGNFGGQPCNGTGRKWKDYGDRTVFVERFSYNSELLN